MPVGLNANVNTILMIRDMIKEQVQAHLRNWLMRKTTNSSMRQVGESSLSIATDIGLSRNENQDRAVVLRTRFDPNRFFVAVALCDGMGGMTEGGECASQVIASFFITSIRFRDRPLAERVVLATQEANRVVNSTFNGKGGATLSAILFDSISGMMGVNVGDSRIYLYKEHKLEQITIDDTIEGQLQKIAKDSPLRNDLLQFIGIGEGIEPHVVEIPVSTELIILTSDGVHFLDQHVMQMVIQNSTEPLHAAKRLVEISKWCGGHDNASVVVVSPEAMQMEQQDPPGVIQIWDPFGELQIIVSESTKNGETRNELAKDGPAPQKGKGLAKHASKQGKNPKPKKQKDTAASSKKKKQEGKKELPLLKVSFGASPDGGNHG